MINFRYTFLFLLFLALFPAAKQSHKAHNQSNSEQQHESNQNPKYDNACDTNRNPTNINARFCSVNYLRTCIPSHYN